MKNCSFFKSKIILITRKIDFVHYVQKETESVQNCPRRQQNPQHQWFYRINGEKKSEKNYQGRDGRTKM